MAILTNIRQLNEESGLVFYPQTHEKAVIDSDGNTLDTKIAGTLKYTEQSLTAAQQGQARTNIGAASQDDLVNIQKEEYVTVATLADRPAASASTLGKIYMVGPDANNQYDKYYTSFDGTAYSWVSAGTTEIDLTTYAKQTDLDQLGQEVTGLYSYSFTSATGEHSANLDKYPIEYKAGEILKGKIELGTAQWNGSALALVLKDSVGTNVLYRTISMGDEFEVSANADAATISFYIYNVTSAGTFIVSLQYGGITKEIDEIENQINTISNNIDGISKTDTIRVNELLGYLIHDFSPTTLNDTAVSSVDGSFVSVNGQKSVEINLTGLPYTEIKFKTTGYGGNYGYGFFVNGVWQGVHTTSVADVEVSIPTGDTVIFRACWNATNVPSNSYIGTAVNSSIGADDIRENKNKIADLEEEIGIISGSGINTLLYAVKRNNIGSQFDFTNVGVYDYYAAFDSLAYTYKDEFAIGVNIGTSTTPEGARATKDSNTYPIKRYTFKKPGSTPSKTIVLCGAIHGDSQSVENGVVYNNNGEWYNDGGDSPQNILCQLFFLADFLENYSKNQLYKYIYDNYAIEVVPILNPWGVQNHSRANGRDVDVARNFDYNWEPGSSYGHSNGTEAFSENESAAFRDFFNSLSGVELCIECHARGDILIPSSVQFLSVVPQTADAFQAKVTSIMSNYITSRFSGSYSPQRSDTPSLVNWVKNVQGVESIEPEFAQTFTQNIYTRNTKLVNYQMTEMLKELLTRLVL